MFAFEEKCNRWLVLASNSGHEIDPNYWSSVNIRAAITGYTWFVIFVLWVLLLGAVKTTELLERKICNSHSDILDNYILEWAS